MDAPTASPTKAIQEDKDGNQNEAKRHEIQSAIAKAMELRALHAALMQQTNSPAHLKFPSASPSAHHNPHFSAQDYPVFTPSYEDEPLPGYPYGLEDQNLDGKCDEYEAEEHEDDSSFSRKINASTRKGLPTDFANNEKHLCPPEHQSSFTSSYGNHPTLLSASPGADFCKSKRSSIGEFRSLSSFNRSNHVILNATTSDLVTKTLKNSNLVVPLTELHTSVHSQPKSRGMSLWNLFPRLKKKNKNVSSPKCTESDEVSERFKEFGVLSVEGLKKELLEANERRNIALREVVEMKSSVGELRQKLECLETYCEDLKKALKQAMQVKNFHQMEKLGTLSKLERSLNENGENPMPVSEAVMTEGFLQMVSEARSSVKHFCKTLLEQIEETDNSLVDSLNMLLLPYKLSLHSKYSKAVLYHLEAIMNQCLYQDFENCIFQKNGTPKFLDPQKDREAQFSSFVALRNLSWNEVLSKGTKYYSEEFSKFCDQKMSYIIAAINWTRPWPEQLLQAFFVAAKCIWLLHLLAFSFNPPLRILRIDENRSFDHHFMDDVMMDKQKSQISCRVKIMVMPGFYVHDRVLRCKVLCGYKSSVK